MIEPVLCALLSLPLRLLRIPNPLPTCTPSPSPPAAVLDLSCPDLARIRDFSSSRISRSAPPSHPASAQPARVPGSARAGRLKEASSLGTTAALGPQRGASTSEAADQRFGPAIVSGRWKRAARECDPSSLTPSLFSRTGKASDSGRRPGRLSISPRPGSLWLCWPRRARPCWTSVVSTPLSLSRHSSA